MSLSVCCCPRARLLSGELLAMQVEANLKEPWWPQKYEQEQAQKEQTKTPPRTRTPLFGCVFSVFQDGLSDILIPS